MIKYTFGEIFSSGGATLFNFTIFSLLLGLVISLWDILEINESHVMAGDGASHTKVTFRLLVFRPFVEENFGGKNQKFESRRSNH